MHDISSVQSIANKLGHVLQEKNLSIVTAESCTGGLVSAAITDIPGSSQWFLQGWITYSNNSKVTELNVPPSLLAKYGAVSEEVVKAMAKGALYKSDADISIATSGIAGPDGGTPTKPVGTVWIAIGLRDLPIDKSVEAQLLMLKGTRTEIRESIVQAVLQKVLQVLN